MGAFLASRGLTAGGDNLSAAEDESADDDGFLSCEASSSSDPEPEPPGRAQAAPPKPPRSGRAARGRRYYVVFACRQDARICGIHHCVWRELVERLPGGSLFQSGARLKAYDTWDDAFDYWRLHRRSETPPLFTY